MNRLPTLSLDQESLAKCLDYSWPGNVSELRHVIERGVLLTLDNTIVLPDLITGGIRNLTEELTESQDDFNLDKMVARHIIRVMRHTGGKVGGSDGAAQLMGLNPSTLRKRMRKLKIPFGRKVNY